MGGEKIKDAVILAAGRGTRLWPYGDTHAKAALPVGNKPLVHYQLNALAAAGVESVAVVTGFLEGMVRAACAGWIATHGDTLDISFVSVPNSKGTAHSALAGLSVRTNPESAAYVLPGDLYLSEEDFLSLASQVPKGKVAALVTPVEKATVQEGFRADLREGKVQSLRAHPRDCEEGSRRFTGVVAVPSDFRKFLEATPEIPTCVEIGSMPPAEPDLAESVHQFLRAGGEVVAVEAGEEVVDINKPWDFLAANMLSAKRQTDALAETILEEGATIDSTAHLRGNVKLGKNSRIGPGVFIYGNVIVGDNTEIVDGAFVEGQAIVGDDCKLWRGCLVGKQSVIGHRCHVGHGAEFEGLMMDESYSYHYGEYWGILGRCSDLGAATVCGTLRFDDGETVHRVKGRKETPRYNANASYLGDYVRTGVNAILMPGVKVGPYSLVGAGVLLSRDVPNNTSIYVEQSLKEGRWGPERYGW